MRWSMSTALCLITWKVAMGRSNCTRSLAYSTARSKACSIDADELGAERDRCRRRRCAARSRCGRPAGRPARPPRSSSSRRATAGSTSQPGHRLDRRAPRAGTCRCPPGCGPARAPSRPMRRRAPIGFVPVQPPLAALAAWPGCGCGRPGRRGPVLVERDRAPGRRRRPAARAGRRGRGGRGDGGAARPRTRNGPGNGQPAHLLEHHHHVDAGRARCRPAPRARAAPVQPRSTSLSPELGGDAGLGSPRRRRASRARRPIGACSARKARAVGRSASWSSSKRELHRLRTYLTPASGRVASSPAWTSPTRPRTRRSATSCGAGSTSTCRSSSPSGPRRTPSRGAPAARTGSWAQMERRRAWQRRLNDGRWAAINWPVEWGGREATVTQNVIYSEEMARLRTPGHLQRQRPLADRSDDHPLGHRRAAAALDPEHPQRRRPLVPGLQRARGRQRPRQPAHDGDRRRRRLRGQRPEDLDLHRPHRQVGPVPPAHRSRRRSSEGRKHEGITALIIDLETPGIECRPIRDITGEEMFCEVFFDAAAEQDPGARARPAG